MFGRKKTVWYKVFDSVEAAENNVPLNRTVSVELDGKKLCLTRNEEGFYALDEKCPHQGLPITRGGFCENGFIVCPFHRYAWDLKTGREQERRESNIHLYPVEKRVDGLFIGIEVRQGWF